MKLEKLTTMTWAEVMAFLEVNAHALALERRGAELDVAKTAMSHGPEAGTAVAVAYLFNQEHGAMRTAWRAIEIYDRICPKSDKIRELKEMVSWGGVHERDREFAWPIEPELENDDKWGGLANVMMAVAADDLARSSTSQLLAAIGLRQFLDEGMKAKQATSV
jgi:hypothetical protein